MGLMGRVTVLACSAFGVVYVSARAMIRIREHDPDAWHDHAKLAGWLAIMAAVIASLSVLAANAMSR